MRLILKIHANYSETDGYDYGNCRLCVVRWVVEEGESYPVELGGVRKAWSRGGWDAYRGELWNDDCYGRKTVDEEIRQIVIRVVRADEEQHNGHTEEELLGWCVLLAVIDLFPHVQVVVGARVEVKGHTANVVEHEVGSRHVRKVD